MLLKPAAAAAGIALTVQPEAGALVLTWPDLGTNYAYRIETRSSLTQGLWTPGEPATQWPIQNTRWRDTNANLEATRFYRLAAIPDSASLRGELISATLISTQSQADINQAFTLFSVPLQAKSGARVYKLTYRTLDAHGSLTPASGALLLPDALAASLPLLSYQHGTVTLKADVPSNLNEEAIIGLAFAASGYATAMPDYVGLGDSPGLHPYHHAKTEASATVDMLRAARTFCATQAVPLNGQLFLAGYSQGGHATMAAHRELEQNYATEFPVTAAAPMAGAYDLSGTMYRDFLSSRSMPNPYYIAYFIMAYRDVYQWTNALDTVLLPSYASQLPGYFDGYHESGQIDALVPAQPKTMFQPAFLSSLQNDPANFFRAALADNDVYTWTPQSPTRLFHCLGDRDVLYTNSQVALEYFHAHGATQVELIDPLPSADHGGGVLPCLIAAKTWFDSLKQ